MTELQQVTPAYAFGRFAGALQRAAQEFGRQLAAGVADGLSGRVLERTDEQRERMAVRAHRLRIAEERRQGIAFVRAEAARVRRELGLEPAHREAGRR
jgi:hypothetical protein